MNPHTPVSHQSVHRPVDYIIVVSNEEDHHAGYHHFAEKVNRKLKAGYQLHGPPFHVEHAICQAMVRLSDAPPSGETTVFFKQSSGYQP